MQECIGKKEKKRKERRDLHSSSIVFDSREDPFEVTLQTAGKRRVEDWERVQLVGQMCCTVCHCMCGSGCSRSCDTVVPITGTCLCVRLRNG